MEAEEWYKTWKTQAHSSYQGRSHEIWSSQVSSACVSRQQLGGSGGMPPPENFWNLEAMRLLLRPFLGQNDASRRPDDRVLHA